MMSVHSGFFFSFQCGYLEIFNKAQITLGFFARAAGGALSLCIATPASWGRLSSFFS